MLVSSLQQMKATVKLRCQVTKIQDIADKVVVQVKVEMMV